MPDSFLPTLPPKHAQRLVVDTNIVLDWLIFGDTHSARWLNAVRDACWLWCASPSILAEYRHMADPARWPGRSALPLDSLSALLQAHPEPAPALNRPRCSDHDDQMFVDLALALAPATLLTRDRALLKMRRRLEGLGVTLASP